LIKLREVITVRKGQSSRSVGKVTLPELLSELTLTVRPDLHSVEFLKTMALSSGKSYSQALQYANRQNMHTSADMSNRQEFTRETEVTAKLPQKKARQYIYDLLTKIKFPMMRIESIVERRGGLVDFTCQTVSQVKQLAVALRGHQGVEFARLVLFEFTDIKVHWIPGRFPNSRIIAAIERHHGKVYETKLLRGRQGIADGRRLYRVKTDDLKARPIAHTVRLDNTVFLVEYVAQPAQCFLCKKFGHVRMNSPWQ